MESGLVAFQPAERAGHYYFVELVGFARCGCQYHPARGARVLSEVRFHFDDRLAKADLGMLDGCFGNVVQDLLVCRCDEEVVCDALSADSSRREDVTRTPVYAFLETEELETLSLDRVTNVSSPQFACVYTEFLFFRAQVRFADSLLKEVK